MHTQSNPEAKQRAIGIHVVTFNDLTFLEEKTVKSRCASKPASLDEAVAQQASLQELGVAVI
jgi:hypothetical protein